MGESIKSFISKYRKKYGLTQELLAQKLGCSVSTVCRLESGEERPGPRLYDRMKACFDLSEIQFYEIFINGSKPLDMYEDIYMELENRRWEVVEKRLCEFKKRPRKDAYMNQLFGTAKLLWEILCRQDLMGDTDWVRQNVNRIQRLVTMELRKTIPEFPIGMEKGDLIYSKTEVLLLNFYAVTCFNMGEKKLAVYIIERLLLFLSETIKGSLEYYKNISALYNNKAVFELRMGLFREAFMSLRKGQEAAIYQSSIYKVGTIATNYHVVLKRLGMTDRDVKCQNVLDTISALISENDFKRNRQESNDGEILLIF